MKHAARFPFIMFSLSVITIPLSAQWMKTNEPFHGNITCMAAGGTYLIAGGNEGVFFTSDGCTSWIQKLGNEYVFSCAARDSILFVATCYPWGIPVYFDYNLNLSTNTGATWRTANAGLPYSRIIALACFGTAALAATDSGVYLSTNNGTDWTPANSGLGIRPVESFAEMGSGLFAGTNDGIFVSTNNGANWNPSGLTNTIICSFAVSGRSLFAGTLAGVFRSSDSGTSWSPFNSGLSTTHVEALAISGSHLFAGTFGGGVFVSAISEDRWTAVNSGLIGDPTHVVHTLGICGSHLIAGTDTGLWMRSIDEMITSVCGSKFEEIETFALSQNHPNPFNPTTIIGYQLPQSSKVNLTIYDILGREVATLIDGLQKAGYHEETFTARRFASGMYVYQLIATDLPAAAGDQSHRHILRKKMLLLK